VTTNKEVMDETSVDNPGGGVVSLGESLTIADVTNLNSEVATIFDSGNRVSIDGSEIEQVDGAGLQLLAVLVKEAAERQVEISWDGVSESLEQAAAQMGIADLLQFSQKV
jgi:anti-anti-sigma regulatory factor